MSSIAPPADLMPRLMNALRMTDQIGLREWAERYIYIPHDYQSYGRGAMQRMTDYPMLFDILERVDKPSVSEVVLIKSVQFGLSQNVLIPAAMRALHRGQPVLFATGLADQAESFRAERLLRLLPHCEAFRHLDIKDRETEVYVSNGGMISMLHNTSRSKTKTRPAQIVLCDELDMFAWGVTERLRGRMTRYNDAKMIMVSALDPDASRKKIEDATVTPALLEWNDSSRGYWHLPDPSAPLSHRHHWFKLEMGFPDEGGVPTSGVMWDHKKARRSDGTIDHARIHETAHYVTPYGTTLTDEDLRRLMPLGRQIDEVESRSDRKPGLMINCLYTPNKKLADWVISYLSAKRMGVDAYRVWMLEKMCELPYLEKIEVSDRTMTMIEGRYTRGDQWTQSQHYRHVCYSGA